MTCSANNPVIYLACSTGKIIDSSIPSGVDIWNLTYIILSFSSEITQGGVVDHITE